MATSKSAVGRKRKPAAARKSGTKRKRKVSVRGTAAPSPATITISGIGRYKKESCHKTKTEAAKQAKKIRSQGAKARVLKSGTGYCTYKRGRTTK